MDKDLIRSSGRLIAEARRVRDDNRAGGRHRLVGLAGGAAKSIGNGSMQMRIKHWVRKLIRAFLAAFAILVGAGVAGLILGGIGLEGILLTVLAMIVVVAVFLVFPRMKPPRRADLNKGDVKQLVGQTELWLEHQRPALPAPAARIVGDIGVQLDALGLQLDNVDPAHPAAQQTRKLVGEYLPEMIETYRRIPANLRREERIGATPDRQLEDSLRKISGEIDHVTRQLADGALDDLAVRTRYLDYKFGGEIGEPEPARQMPRLERR